MASIRARLARIKDDPAGLIDPELVARACREAGHRWRERTLDPVRTLRVFAVQVAHGNTAIAHAIRLAGGGFTESAYCQARARLPPAVVRAVLDGFTARARGERTDASGLWRGHRAVLIDGSGISTPDTPELRGVFGTASGCAEGCGLPLLRALTVFDADTGLLLGLHAAPATTHDLRHAHELHPALEPGDVLVGDRGLCAYTHLAALREIGCHGVFRVPATRALPFPAKSGERARLGYNRHRRHEPILVELVSESDQVVEIVKPANRPKHMSPGAFAKVPGKMLVRAVRYTAGSRGLRTRAITLLTTLTDAKRYPAHALAELYLMRWRIEVNLRHLKRTMGMDRLKCKSIGGVTRELLMFALVYNAVCRVRAGTARAAGVAPHRVSFVDTLRAMLAVGRQAPGIRARPPGLKLWPLRPPRTQPRQVKRAHSAFRVMTWPRSRLVAWIETHRETAN
jgi:hypothetical protein